MAQLPLPRTTQLTNLIIQQLVSTDTPFQIVNPAGVVVASIDASGDLTVAGNLAAAANPGFAQVAYAKYNKAVDGGAISTITPAVTSTIPANAVVYGALINSPTAPVGAGASVSIGTSAGSSTTSIVGATAITGLTVDAIVAATLVWTAAEAFKMSAAGKITFTITSDALTAGVVEVWVFYVLSSAA